MSEVPVPVGSAGASAPGAALGAFTLELSFFYPVPPQRTFQVFVHRINEWWDQLLHPEARVVLEPAAGGQFAQIWSNGGAQLGVVTYIEAPFRLRIGGPLAMARPCLNVVDVTFQPTSEDGTKLHLRHDALGDLDGEVEATYERSWQDLVGRAFGARLDAG